MDPGRPRSLARPWQALTSCALRRQDPSSSHQGVEHHRQLPRAGACPFYPVGDHRGRATRPRAPLRRLHLRARPRESPPRRAPHQGCRRMALLSPPCEGRPRLRVQEQAAAGPVGWEEKPRARLVCFPEPLAPLRAQGHKPTVQAPHVHTALDVPCVPCKAWVVALTA